MAKLTQEQIESIVLDYGILYINYGETDSALIGPTRDGVEFSATANVREIEFDGRRGKTSGMRVIDEQNATIKTSILSTDLDVLGKLLIKSKYTDGGSGSNGKLSNPNSGVIPSTKLLKNATVFGKTIGGGYKKITIKNAGADNDLTLSYKDKSEGVTALEISAHYDPTTEIDTQEFWTIEDVASIEAV